MFAHRPLPEYPHPGNEGSNMQDIQYIAQRSVMAVFYSLYMDVIAAGLSAGSVRMITASIFFFFSISSVVCSHTHLLFPNTFWFEMAKFASSHAQTVGLRYL